MDIGDIDMDAVVDRYDRTFVGDNDDRPLFWISYGLGREVELPPAPPTIRERWFDFEWRVERFERRLANTGFMCEGFPHFDCNLGPDILAACTGSELIFESDATSWAKFRVNDWQNEPPLEFKEDGFYWQTMKRFVTLSAERGAGRWLTQAGDLHTNGDGLSALRGPQNLLLDLYDCPEEIHKRLAECHGVFERMLNAHIEIIHPRSNGLNSCWCTGVCHGRYITIQNDFCCMVGPDLFDTFFKDYVEKEAACVDRCVYHLDGPGAVRHLESICEAEHLHTIQWVPGTGGKPMNQWPELLQRVQELGKGLWLHGSAETQLDILRQVRPEGCLYNVHCRDREEAERFLKKAEEILKGKRNTRVSGASGLR